jgi:hypothetical protein
VELTPPTIEWLQTLSAAIIGALSGGAVSAITTAIHQRRRWARGDGVFWRGARVKAYAATLENLIDARGLLLDARRARGGGDHEAIANALRALSSRAAPVNSATRMIAAPDVRNAVVEAAVALDVDYSDHTAFTVERVEGFRALVRQVHREMSRDLLGMVAPIHPLRTCCEARGIWLDGCQACCVREVV